MANRSILHLIRQARAGDVESQFNLGKLYLKGGLGLGANQHSAFLWLDKAAAQGHGAAWQLIGQSVSPGVAGHADSSRRLRRWYELAANDGCVMAQVKLAKLLLSDQASTAVPQPPQAAMRLLRSAAAQGEAGAKLELGICLLKDDVDRGSSAAEAIALLEQAHAAGKTAAARHLGDYYWRESDAERAYVWYSRCVDLRDAEVCYRFGMLRALRGEPAARLLERAAAARHPLACEELGLRHAIGWCRDAGGAPNLRNFKKAVRWLERAASLGSAKACFFLALLYAHENCSFRDQESAREWLFEAARRGHPEAQYRAALRLLRDVQSSRTPNAHETRGEEADVVAVRFLAEAAQQGHEQASRALDEGGYRAPRLNDIQTTLWARAVAAMEPVGEHVAMRLKLAGLFGLRVCELLMIEPDRAHRGNCLVLDLHHLGVKLRRRIIIVETEAQSEAADAAYSLFRAGSAAARDLHGGYLSRYHQFLRRCRRAGIEYRRLRNEAT